MQGNKKVIPRAPIAIILFVAGVMLAAFGVFSPIHEIWHVRASEKQGIPARVTGPKRMEMKEFTLRTMWAGYGNELMFSSFICMGCAIVGRRSRLVTGSLWLGYGLQTWVNGFLSMDFNKSPKVWITSKYPNDPKAWESLHNWILETWAIRGGIILFIVIVVFIICWHKSKAPVKPGAKNHLFELAE